MLRVSESTPPDARALTGFLGIAVTAAAIELVGISRPFAAQRNGLREANYQGQRTNIEDYIAELFDGTHAREIADTVSGRQPGECPSYCRLFCYPTRSDGRVPIVIVGAHASDRRPSMNEPVSWLRMEFGDLLNSAVFAALQTRIAFGFQPASGADLSLERLVRSLPHTALEFGLSDDHTGAASVEPDVAPMGRASPGPSDGVRSHRPWPTVYIRSQIVAPNDPLLSSPGILAGNPSVRETEMIESLDPSRNMSSLSSLSVHQAMMKKLADQTRVAQLDVASPLVRQGEQCPICLEDFAVSAWCRILHCEHTFHRDCLDAWFKQERNTCPLCRKLVVSGGPTPLSHWAYSQHYPPLPNEAMAHFEQLREAAVQQLREEGSEEDEAAWVRIFGRRRLRFSALDLTFRMPSTAWQFTHRNDAFPDPDLVMENMPLVRPRRRFIDLLYQEPFTSPQDTPQSTIPHSRPPREYLTGLRQRLSTIRARLRTRAFPANNNIPQHRALDESNSREYHEANEIQPQLLNVSDNLADQGGSLAIEDQGGSGAIENQEGSGAIEDSDGSSEIEYQRIADALEGWRQFRDQIRRDMEEMHGRQPAPELPSAEFQTTAERRQPRVYRPDLDPLIVRLRTVRGLRPQTAERVERSGEGELRHAAQPSAEYQTIAERRQASVYQPAAVPFVVRWHTVQEPRPQTAERVERPAGRRRARRRSRRLRRREARRQQISEQHQAAGRPREVRIQRVAVLGSASGYRVAHTAAMAKNALYSTIIVASGFLVNMIFPPADIFGELAFCQVEKLVLIGWCVGLSYLLRGLRTWHSSR